MKITVCGKGGCGKSTIAALLAMALASKGMMVIVMDCDESNYGLKQHLVMELPEPMIDSIGGKTDVYRRMFAGSLADIPMFHDHPLRMSDIDPKFISERNGIRLTCSGKVKAADESCACPFFISIGQFFAQLQLDEDEIILIDTEGGIEHFARGTDDSTDTVVMVVDPTYKSIVLSKKIADIAGGIGKPVYYILNKMDDAVLPMVEEGIPDRSLVIGIVREDADLEEDALDGNEVDADSDVIRDIVARLPFRRCLQEAVSL